MQSKEDDFNERNEKLRKEESLFEIRDKAIKQDQVRIDKKDRELDNERTDIKEREEKSKKAAKEANEKEKEYTTKLKDLEHQETALNRFRDELNHREAECLESQTIYESNLKKHQELEELKAKLLKEHEETEAELNERIAEYERKCVDFEAMQETMDSIAFDKTPEGKKAKIVVKEALRAAIEQLNETVGNLKDIDKQYNTGTFKGFAIPLNDIDKIIKQVKSDFDEICEHNVNNGNLFDVWLEKIEEYIAEGGKSRKKHLYGDTYRNYVLAQSYCDSYLVMVNIINDIINGSASDDETVHEDSSDWKDYYEIFGVDPNINQKDLKKGYNKLAKEHHSDVNGEDDEMMKEINEAWNILKNKDTRAKYDETYEQMKNQYKKGA